MKTVAVVPIKMNNERLPGKNVKRFSDGTPLIEIILKTLCAVPELGEIYVYCSDPSIRAYFPSERIRYLRRDESLDRSETKINEVLTAFAREVPADLYLLAHATAPFIEARRFSEGIRAVSGGEYDSALAVTETREFLWKDGKPMNYDPAAIPRTQDMAPLYTETAGMYIYSSEQILGEGRRVGKRPYLAEVTKTEATDINDAEDFAIADAIYTHILRGGGVQK